MMTSRVTASPRQLGRQVAMVYNNLDWDAAASSLERALSVSFASRYIQLTKVRTVRRRGGRHTWRVIAMTRWL